LSGVIVGCGASRALAADEVRVDGSSTVAPITMAAAELFAEEQPKINVTVGISGTGGGFKKFVESNAALRTDICDASRPIKAEEASRAAAAAVEFIEVPIAYDGMAVVVHPSNAFCDHLSVEELKRIWEPGSKINNWKDVRAGFPDVPLRLYGAGTDSGTFDYFTEAICGKEDASRADYTASEDDNVLATGVAGDKGALGYFGYAYYEANKSRLKLLGVAAGGEPVKPTHETIRKRTYVPLSRPLFLYVNKASLERPAVKAFLDFYLANAKAIVEHPKVNYIALSDTLYGKIGERVRGGVTGSVYGAPGASQKSLYTLYGIEDQ
jgi:phosphate transport system substrate-binding protein